MNKRLLSGMFAAFLLISGCSSDEDEKEKVEESRNGAQNSKDSTQNVEGDSGMDTVESLDQVITEAEEVKKENYSEASYNEFKKVVDNAKMVKENKEATPTEIESAMKAVEEAKKGLQEKESQGDQQVASAEAVTNVTNTAIVFGFTSVQGSYNVEKVDKIDFFVGDSPTARTATLNPDGTFNRDLASDAGQKLSFKAYKGSELIQKGEYTVK